MANGTALSKAWPLAVGAVLGVGLTVTAYQVMQVMSQAFTRRGIQPVLDLRFDGVVNGYVRDYSPYGHHARVEGAPVLLPVGGMEFKSTRGDRLVVANDWTLNTQEITLEMVVRPRTYTPEANPGWMNSVGIGKFHDQYELNWNADKRFIFIVTDTVGNFRWARTLTEVDLDTVHHVVGSYSLTRPLRIMLDGNFEYGYGQDASRTGYELRRENSDLIIGDHGDKKYCDGTFHLVRVWPAGVLDEDIVAMFQDASRRVPGVQKAPANWPPP